MGQCQVKILFQNNLLTMLNKHLRLDKLHGFCLITFPQLILFHCQCLTSIEAQTEQASRFLLHQQCRDARSSRMQCGAHPNPAGLQVMRGTSLSWARTLTGPSPAPPPPPAGPPQTPHSHGTAGRTGAHAGLQAWKKRRLLPRCPQSTTFCWSSPAAFPTCSVTRQSTPHILLELGASSPLPPLLQALLLCLLRVTDAHLKPQSLQGKGSWVPGGSGLGGWQQSHQWGHCLVTRCLCRSNSPAGRHQEQSSLVTHRPIAGEFSSFLVPSVSKEERQ